MNLTVHRKYEINLAKLHIVWLIKMQPTKQFRVLHLFLIKLFTVLIFLASKMELLILQVPKCLGSYFFPKYYIQKQFLTITIRLSCFFTTILCLVLFFIIGFQHCSFFELRYRESFTINLRQKSSIIINQIIFLLIVQKLNSI